MSLFGQRWKLCRSEYSPLEDFHTEIVAQVLRDSPALVFAWLRQVGATTLSPCCSYNVETQETFSALASHNVDSRLDMVIRLEGEGRREIVFVESKVGSFAGEGQLARYMDHLADHRISGLAERAALVFVTRTFEAIDIAEFSGAAFYSAGVLFCQTRWSRFYHLLSSIARNDSLGRQLALFMQEHCMNLRHRFRTLDLAALENFLAAKSLMDDTLDSKLGSHIQAKFQTVSRLHDALSQLSKHSRYILYADSWKAFASVLVGYYLPDEPDAEVWVGVMLTCSPGAVARNDYVAAFREWDGRGNGWKGANLDRVQEWCLLAKGRDLSSFLAEPDHVESIRAYLTVLVDEAADFWAAHPTLPWRGEAAGSAPAAGCDQATW